MNLSAPVPISKSAVDCLPNVSLLNNPEDQDSHHHLLIYYCTGPSFPSIVAHIYRCNGMGWEYRPARRGKCHDTGS
jgi:hypothetical protein